MSIRYKKFTVKSRLDRAEILQSDPKLLSVPFQLHPLLPAAPTLQTPPEPQQQVSDTPLSAGTALTVEKGDILLVLLSVEQLLVAETCSRCCFACGACREMF